MELDVALIVFCRLWGFVSSDESHFFFHSLASAGMDAEDDRSWQKHSRRSVMLASVSLLTLLGRNFRSCTAFPNDRTESRVKFLEKMV